MESLQRLLARSEENRIASNTTLAGLTDRLGAIGEHMNAAQTQIVRLAENSAGQSDVLRTHLRNIEGYVARLTEDLAEGRAQSVSELRNEIRLLARTIAAIADENSR
jgi:ABC-type transporter Mla subunit MlaD